MKIVTTYVAFDDTEFDTAEKCKVYENHYIDLMIEAKECYSFYYKDMCKMVLVCGHNIEDMLSEFCYAYDNCECIVVNKEPSASLIDLMWRYFGYELPRERGMWRYNYMENCWERA